MYDLALKSPWSFQQPTLKPWQARFRSTHRDQVHARVHKSCNDPALYLTHLSYPLSLGERCFTVFYGFFRKQGGRGWVSHIGTKQQAVFNMILTRISCQYFPRPFIFRYFDFSKQNSRLPWWGGRGGSGGFLGNHETFRKKTISNVDLYIHFHVYMYSLSWQYHAQHSMFISISISTSNVKILNLTSLRQIAHFVALCAADILSCG